jgi:glycosyltransferase involved in cell wall biosynthesis
MKICFVNPSVGSIRGGAEAIIINLMLELKDKHDITLITGVSKDSPILPEVERLGVRTIKLPFVPRTGSFSRFTEDVFSRTPAFIPRMKSYDVESFSMFAGLLRRPSTIRQLKEADVISTHYQTDGVLFSRLFRASTPVVLQMNGGHYGSTLQRFDRSVVRLTNSASDWRYNRDKIGIKLEGVFVPGVTTSLFARKGAERPLEAPYLLYVGRLVAAKGVSFLLRVFGRLLEKHGDLKLVVVGTGPEKEALEREAQSLGFGPKVFFTGDVPDAALHAYYEHATALVFPVVAGSFGIVVGEAMAFGIPVVTTNIPGLVEFWKDAAILVPPEDLDSWVGAVESILKDDGLRKDLAERGRERARKYAWDKRAEEYVRFLDMAMMKKQ